MWKNASGTIAALALLASPVFAADGNTGLVEFSPFFGVGLPDGYAGHDPDNGPVAGGRFGYFLMPPLNLEVTIQRLFTNALGKRGSIDGFRFNGGWSFLNESDFRPFVTLGLGMEMSFLQPAVDETSFAINVGGGCRYYLGKHAGLRFDARWIPTDVGGLVDKWEQNFDFTAGIFFLFGKRSEMLPPPPAAPAAAPTPEPTPTP